MKKRLVLFLIGILSMGFSWAEEATFSTTDNSLSIPVIRVDGLAYQATLNLALGSGQISFTLGALDLVADRFETLLDGPRWELYSFGRDVDPVTQNGNYYLILDWNNQKFSGKAQCNFYDVPITHDIGDQFTASLSFITANSCFEDEQIYADALNLGTSYKVEGTELEIFDAEGNSLLIFHDNGNT